MDQLNIFPKPPEKPPPVAVHVKDGCDMYCGRRFREWVLPSPKNPIPGRFGNPFRKGGVRPHELMLWLVEEPEIPKEVYTFFLLSLDTEWAQELNRADPIRAFEMYLLARVEVDPAWRAALLALDGLRLGCWCKDPYLALRPHHAGIRYAHHLTASFDERGSVQVRLGDVRPPSTEDDVVLGVAALGADPIYADAIEDTPTSHSGRYDHLPARVEAQAPLARPGFQKNLFADQVGGEAALPVATLQRAHHLPDALLERVVVYGGSPGSGTVLTEALLTAVAKEARRTNLPLSAVVAEPFRARQHPQLQLVRLRPDGAQRKSKLRDEGFRSPVGIELSKLGQLLRVHPPVAMFHELTPENRWEGSVVVMQQQPRCHVDVIVKWIEANS